METIHEENRYNLEKSHTYSRSTINQLPKGALCEADGIMVACPEYNSSVTPLLKNTIDWLSRPQEGEPRLGAFSGKVVGIMGTSPGALGAMRVLRHAREIFGNIGCLVVPEQVAVPNGSDVFAADGSITDEATKMRLEDMVKAMVKATRSFA